MSDPSDTSVKYRVLELAEAHPYILLGAVLMLVVIILILCFGSKVPVLSKICGRRAKKESLEDEDEMDKLIESIHSKQKKKK